MDPRQAYARVLMYGGDGPYDTKLREGDDRHFDAWKRFYAPNDSGQDYDLRGAFKARVKPDPQTGHWPDTFKKPNHPTFSDQSQYARDPNVGYAAGRWDGNDFIPSPITTPY